MDHHSSLGSNSLVRWATDSVWRTGDDLLLRLVDVGLVGTIFFVPYFMGGRYATGQLVFVLLVAVTATLWSIRTLTDRRRQWVRTPADWIVPAGILLIVFQSVRLPVAAVAMVSPKMAMFLPTWAPTGDAAGRLGVWNRISLVPEATLGGLAIFAAYGLLFLVVVQRVKHLSDILRIMRWIALSAAVMAVFGLLQYLFSNGKFLWVYEHPFRTTSVHVNGSFINRNHFTHLLALGLGPVLLGVMGAFRPGVRQSGDHGARRHSPTDSGSEGGIFWRVAIGLIAFAGLMSLSRGGAIVMAITLVVFLAHAFRARRLGRRLLVGGLVVATVVVTALSIHGYDRVAHRLDDLRSASLDRLDRHHGRRQVWVGNLAAIADYPLLGTGLGSHREVHPMYRDDSPEVEYTHAENGYLQVASETGLVGLALLLTGMAICTWWCFRTAMKTQSAELLLAGGAVAGGLAASAVHSLIDFVWYIPACMSITVILAACAARLWHLTRAELSAASVVDGGTSQTRPERPSAPPAGALIRHHQRLYVALTGVVLGVSLWMVANRLPAALASRSWDNYLRQSLAQSHDQRLQLRAARRGAISADAVVLPQADREQITAAMIAELRQAVARHPGHARAHVRLAAAYMEQFDQLQSESPNAMDLSQIRDAAIASKFGSRVELDRWLARAFGPSSRLLDKADWHARRGIELCPLQGEAYLFLAELGFLQGADHRFTSACIDQALRVRPHDERVLFAAGKEAALAGDLAGAIDRWRACFHVRGSYQLQLVRLLASQVPVTFFLDNFEPQFDDLQLLYPFYRGRSQPAEMAAFCAHCVDAARAEAPKRPPSDAADMWLSASRICRELNALRQSIACAESAEEAAPDHFQVHLTLATLRLEADEPVEAERQLRWCLARKPADPRLRSLLEQAVRRRLARRAPRVSF